MKTLKNKPNTLNLTSRVWQIYYELAQVTSGSPSSRKYNLSISHSYRFIWFRVAKNGTRTTLSTLKNNGVPLDVEHAFNIRYSVGIYKDYFKFAFIRNPWDRLVSCWLGKVVRRNAFKFEEKQYQKLKTFSNFIDHISTLDIENCDCHLASQSSLIDLNEVDYLARVETFEYDLSSIFRKIGINNFELTVKNVRKGRTHYRDYYSGNLEEKVYRIYEKDIQLFGYTYGK